MTEMCALKVYICFEWYVLLHMAEMCALKVFFDRGFASPAEETACSQSGVEAVGCGSQPAQRPAGQGGG